GRGRCLCVFVGGMAAVCGSVRCVPRRCHADAAPSLPRPIVDRQRNLGVCIGGGGLGRRQQLPTLPLVIRPVYGRNRLRARPRCDRGRRPAAAARLRNSRIGAFRRGSETCQHTGSMRQIVLASTVVGFAAVFLASAGVGLAAVLGGCGGRGPTAATAPATTQATTAAPSAPTTTAASSPGALQAEANAAAAGDIPDNQVFLVFHNARAGYSMKYPEGWAQQGGTNTVVFRDKNNIARIAVGSGPTPTAASVKQELRRLKGASVVSAPQLMQLPGGRAYKVGYSTESAPNAVRGKRVRLVVARYYVAQGGHHAVVDLGTPQGVDNVDAYRLMIESFRWR